MKISIDTFVTKGYSHYLCEDYATHVDTDNYCAVIISDGCSASTNTDVGSSLVALSAKKHLEYLYKYLEMQEANNTSDIDVLIADKTAFPRLVASSAFATATSLELNPASIDATLMIALYDKKRDNVSLFLYGDGNVIIKSDVVGESNYEETSWANSEYSNNRPFYPSYHAIKSRLNGYLNLCDSEEGKYIVNIIYKIGMNDTLSSSKTTKKIKDSYHQSLDGRKVKHANTTFKESTTPLDFDTIIQTHTTESTIKTVIITSDGLTTFTKKENGETLVYDSEKLIDKIADFKNFNGQFLHRRMNRVMKELHEEGYENFDDLSIGVIHFEED